VRDIPPFAPTRDIPPFDTPGRDFPPEVPRPGTPRRFPDSDDDPYTIPERPRGETGGGFGVPGFRIELPAGTGIPGLPGALGCLKKLLVLALIGAILFALASAWFFSSVFLGSRDVDRHRDAGVQLASDAGWWHTDDVAPRRDPPRHVRGTGRWPLTRGDAGEAAAPLAVA
jgi:hypothetical protein